MPRFTLVQQTIQHFSVCPNQVAEAISCPIDDARDIVAELRSARDGMTDGPAILWLVNELMHCCELMFEADAAELAGSCPTARMRRNLLSRLTGFAEDIRRSNGELSDEFIDFIASTPDAMGAHTAN